MKRFNQWLNAVPHQLRECYRGLDGIGCLRFRQSPRGTGGNGIEAGATTPAELRAACPPGVPLERFVSFVGILMSRAFDGEHASDLLESWTFAGLWRDGPRVYAPTADEFRALSQVEVGVPWDEYRQPFETFVVAVPDGILCAPLDAAGAIPAAIVCRHAADRRCAGFSLPAVDAAGRLCNSLHCGTWWPADSGVTIEEHFAGLPDAYEVTPGESAALELVKRVAINAALLLTHHGARKLGAANPDYEAKLLASLAKRGLPDGVRRANEAALKALPIMYGFDQHVKVYEREGGAPHGGAGGYEVKTHWRRGHWARQAHGPHGALRKLVFRPAVLVNAHRFGGAPADTRVTLTTSRGDAT